MKVSCLKKDLAKGLSIVGRAVKKSTLPVLSNVMLATDNGRLKLSATNLELGINCWVGAKVGDVGATTVPAKMFTKAVKALPSEQIDLELELGEDDTETLKVTCAQAQTSLPGITAQEFPIVPTKADDWEHTTCLFPETLRQMIDQVVLAAATGESRPILTGVLAQFEEDRLTVAAADGYRLSVRKNILLSRAIEDAVTINVPAQALKLLTRSVSKKAKDPVEIYISPARNQVLFRTQDIEVASQLIEGKYPDFQQIIPVSYTTRIVLDTAEFLNATSAALPFVRRSDKYLRLEIADAHVALEATSDELGSYVMQLNASIEGDPLEIAFNAKYLVDVLKAIDTDQVILETTLSSDPGLIRPAGDDDFVYVIMPMAIRS